MNEGAPALWVEVEDLSTLPAIGRVAAPALPSQPHPLASRIRLHAAGIVSTGPTNVRTGDPFGVYTVALSYPASMPCWCCRRRPLPPSRSHRAPVGEAVRAPTRSTGYHASACAPTFLQPSLVH